MQDVNERTITMQVRLDGRQVQSETTAWVTAYVLVICTVLPQRDLAIEINSTFMGHLGVPTLAAHLTLGPIGHAPVAISAEHEHANIDPQLNPRACAYEHAGILVEALNGLANDVAVDIPEDAFQDLERIEN